LDKVIQLPLPLVWWADSEKWRIRHTVDVTSRPTEDAALDNVYYAARLANGLRLGTNLSRLEQRIYRLERQVKLMPAYADSTPFDRAKWIYAQLENQIVSKRRGKLFTKASPFAGQVSGIRQVLAILDDVSYAMRGYAQHEDWLERNWEAVILNEVLGEFAEKAPVPLAA